MKSGWRTLSPVMPKCERDAMEWLYVAMIIGTMVYSGGIVIEYTNRALEIRPKIGWQFNQALKLADAAEVELREKEASMARSRDLRAEIGEFQHAVDLRRTRLKTEEMRHKRLEMALIRTRLRQVHQSGSS